VPRFASACLALLALMIASVPGPAVGQTAAAPLWPSRPLALIVSSAPGAGVDFFARLLADQLPARIGQPVVVENRPGASGMIAAAQVAHAAPDGHVLFLMPNTLVVARHVLSTQAATVDVITELSPVILPVSTSMVLALNARFADARGIGSVAQLVTHARREPGLPYASGVNGSPMHFLGEQFARSNDLQLVHVPYKGVAQAVTAALGGQLNLIWMPTSGNLQHFRSGALRALASASPARSPLLPEVPTMTELGFPAIEATAWFGVLAPRGVPAPVIGRLNQEINAVLAVPLVRERLLAAGYEPEGGPPGRLARQMRDDDTRYQRLARELSIRSD
jgi:tripartite-type tricarboxylate transporter receptor subunit TctC